MSLDRLQQHETDRALELPATAKALHRQLRGALLEASNAGQLVTSPHEIYQRALLLDEPPPAVRNDLRARGLQTQAFCIVGGEKNQNRDPNVPHLRRDDGAWFDFSITVREKSGQLELLAYDFEIRFPPGWGTPYLRFDLNLPHHQNEIRELRCHLHPGSDEILVPAPMMSPAELLFLCLDQARLPATRERRSLTNFEVDWFGKKHALSKRE